MLLNLYIRIFTAQSQTKINHILILDGKYIFGFYHENKCIFDVPLLCWQPVGLHFRMPLHQKDKTECNREVNGTWRCPPTPSDWARPRRCSRRSETRRRWGWSARWRPFWGCRSHGWGRRRRLTRKQRICRDMRLRFRHPTCFVHRWNTRCSGSCQLSIFPKSINIWLKYTGCPWKKRPLVRRDHISL